jgi:hypothetical protein
MHMGHNWYEVARNVQLTLTLDGKVKSRQLPR